MQDEGYDPVFLMVQFIEVIPVRTQNIDLLVLAFFRECELALQIKLHEVVEAVPCLEGMP